MDPLKQLGITISTMDTLKQFGITLNPDGSITRHIYDPRVPPTGDHLPPNSSEPVLTKDITLNNSHNTYIRIYRPITNTTSTSTSTSTSKLPIILYIHGGGLALFSASTLYFHKSCSQMAAQLPALVLSLDHRLAPEHRLPAAYDDALEALLWVRDQAQNTTEKWLDQADFSNCYIMGNSSGGNIALHATLRAMEVDLNPVKISGLIMYQPGFGGEERTESEKRMEKDKVLPREVLDLIFELGLPEGANRDHEYSNPMKLKGKVRVLPRCLIRGYLGDPMIDRQRVFADMLEEEGVTVMKSLDVEGFHAIDLVDSDKAAGLLSMAMAMKQIVGDTEACSKGSMGAIIFDPGWN